MRTVTDPRCKCALQLKVCVLTRRLLHPFSPTSGAGTATWGAGDDDKQRVRDATDIVDLVGEHITLKPAGKEFKCLCPFHDDRNPSMCVVPHKQLFHCFVCGASGDAFTFVMKYHGMGFREALEFLAQRAGIELTQRRQEPQRERAPGEPTKDELAQSCAFAQGFYQTILNHPQHGADARACLQARGISDEMIEAFSIGAAPEIWDGLVKTASAKIDDNALVGAGLTKRRDSGGMFDMLRHRLVFPIHDQAGRPIAFGGRKLNEDDEPKYLNTPETPLFDKGSTLYGLAQGGRAIRKSRRVIVTEGYTDVVACHQHGFTNVVATLGTALTEKHARVLRRMCDEVVLLFDGDEAGQRAADRAFEVFFPEAMDVRVVVLPGGADPDDLLKQEGGAEAFRKAIENATDVLEHRVRRLDEQLRADGHAQGSAARGRVVEQTAQRLVELGLMGLPPVRRRVVIDRLASIAGVDGATVLEAARGSRRAPARREHDSETEAKPVARPIGPAQHALACLLEDGRLAHRAPDDTRLVFDACATDWDVAPLVAVMRDVFERGDDPDIASIVREHDDERTRRTGAAFAHFARTTVRDSLGAYLADCVERLRLEASVRETRATDDAGDALEAAIAARRQHQTNATGLTRHASRAVRAANPVPDTTTDPITPTDGGPHREA